MYSHSHIFRYEKLGCKLEDVIDGGMLYLTKNTIIELLNNTDPKPLELFT